MFRSLGRFFTKFCIVFWMDPLMHFHATLTVLDEHCSSSTSQAPGVHLTPSDESTTKRMQFFWVSHMTLFQLEPSFHRKNQKKNPAFWEQQYTCPPQIKASCPKIPKYILEIQIILFPTFQVRVSRFLHTSNSLLTFFTFTFSILPARDAVGHTWTRTHARKNAI